MNKTEFMNELRQKLHQLPHAEIENAMNYYEEYFNDAGAQYEQRVLTELGSPSAVAAKIIGEYAVSDAEARKSRSTSPIWMVILAICASPIAIPLIIVIFALTFSLFAVLFALGISGAALVFGGGVSVVAGIWAAITNFSTGLFYVGAGLFIIALGIALIAGITALTRITFWSLQKTLGKLLIRRSAK